MSEETHFTAEDRERLIRVDERQRTLFANQGKLEKRVGRIEIGIGSLVLATAGLSLTLILKATGLM